MASRFLLVAALVLGASLPVLGDITQTTYGDASCAVGGSVTTIPNPLGTCVNSLGTYYKWFVSAASDYAFQVEFSDPACASWSKVTRYDAGESSCMLKKSASGITVNYIKTIVPPAAERNATAVPPFGTIWPLPDALEIVECANQQCSSGCVSSQAQRIGTCAGKKRYACSPDRMFMHYLTYEGAGCSGIPVTSWSILTNRTSPTLACTMYSSLSYIMCPDVITDPNAMVTMEEVPVVQYSCTGGGNGKSPLSVHMFANGSCNSDDRAIYMIADDKASTGLYFTKFKDNMCAVQDFNRTVGLHDCVTTYSGFRFDTKGNFTKELKPLACAAGWTTDADCPPVVPLTQLSSSSSTGSEDSSSSGPGGDPGAAQTGASLSFVALAAAALLALLPLRA